LCGNEDGDASTNFVQNGSIGRNGILVSGIVQRGNGTMYVHSSPNDARRGLQWKKYVDVEVK
jgi:hypothetical protein